MFFLEKLSNQKRYHMVDIINVEIPKTVIGMGSVNSINNLVKEFRPEKILIITMEDLVKAELVNKVISPLTAAGRRPDVFEGCKPNAPSSSIEKCNEVVRNSNYDLLIGFGGGSAIDTTKIVSVMAPNSLSFQDIVSDKEMRKVISKIFIPTTAGTGSEWDEGAVALDESTGQSKWMVREEFFANAVVIDAEMTLGLPKKVTADTGIDALSHALEAYISPGANILSDMFAEAAIRLISENLRSAYAGDRESREARYKMSIAAAVGMKAQMLGGGSLAHALNSQVVVSHNCTHGAACSILLPYNMEFVMPAVAERLVKIAELMGEETCTLSTIEASNKAVEAVRRLSFDVGMPQRLSDVGVTEADLPKFADNLIGRIETLTYRSFRHIDREEIVQFYKSAL
jgi:alcohol dehydrogenase class IV